MESKWRQIANEFGLIHNHNRKLYKPDIDLPEYCLIYKIEFLYLKSNEQGIIWFSNLKELESFLKFELPINFLRKFMEFSSNVSESAIATDLEFFFTDEFLCRQKLSAYQKGINEIIQNYDFQRITSLLSDSFTNDNGWFSSIPQIKWLGSTSLLLQTPDIEVKSFIKMFDSFKFENGKVVGDINDFNIYNSLQKAFTDFDILFNSSSVEMRDIQNRHTFDEYEKVKNNFKSYFNSNKASFELIDSMAKDINSHELKNATRIKIEEYVIKFKALESEFFLIDENIL